MGTTAHALVATDARAQEQPRASRSGTRARVGSGILRLLTEQHPGVLDAAYADSETNEVVAIDRYSQRPTQLRPGAGARATSGWGVLPDEVTVVIVATWPTMRMGLRMLIEATPGFTVVAEGSAGFDLLASLPDETADEQPQVLVIDVDPERIADARQLLAHWPDAATLLLVDGPEDLPEVLGPHQPLPERATAVLLRDSTASEIHAALQAALAGMVVLDPTIVADLRLRTASPASDDLRATTGAAHARDRPTHDDEDDDDEADPRDVLTERERQVLHLVALGMPNKGIAAELGISEHTAKFHVGAILAKLSAASRAEAVAIAARRGLLSL